MKVNKIDLNNSPNIVANSKSNSSKSIPFGNAKTNDTVEISEKPKEASTAKKWGVGIASGCITGLGQIINGEVGKGFAMLGTAFGLGLLGNLGGKKSTAIRGLSYIAAFGVGVYSIVDAVKNAKPSKK